MSNYTRFKREIESSLSEKEKCFELKTNYLDV